MPSNVFMDNRTNNELRDHDMTIVKETFTHTFGHGGSVVVPAGARTTSASAFGGFRWVDPSIFDRDSIEYHDAEYYGIRVYPDNLTEGEKA